MVTEIRRVGSSGNTFRLHGHYCPAILLFRMIIQSLQNAYACNKYIMYEIMKAGGALEKPCVKTQYLPTKTNNLPTKTKMMNYQLLAFC